MSAILYWLIIKPISLLPYPLLYGFSNFLFLILYRLIGYRKEVVRSNLKGCFPAKSDAEILDIEQKFYRHFCDLVVESLKNFSIREDEAARRMVHINPEIFKPFAEKGQSVFIAGGHYSNWELWAVTAAGCIPHKVIGIYKRLSNKYFDAKMQESRGKFGLGLIATRETGDYLRLNQGELNALVFAIDQSPSNPLKCLWINFLGRETAALFGTEKFGVMYNRPIIFGHMRKVKRGYYEVWYELICEKPAETSHGYLTQRLSHVLEQDILKAPEYWLWSHKRWKHKRPAEAQMVGPE